MKRKSKRNLSLLFLFFTLSILFISCEIPPGDWEYEFINKSSYSIIITLHKEFTLTKDEDSPNYYSETSLNPNSSITVYVKADSVNFTWTASSVSDNRYIYVDADGSKVTFNERAK
jgi:hypothetical protein